LALYPGTFDPITRGHLDIIERAAQVVDHLVVGVAANPGKTTLFSLDERVALAQHDVATLIARTPLRATIEVQAYDTLLMHFAETLQARAIVRGLRAVSDFEYEFQMAGMNLRLNKHIETMFLMASDRFQFIASRLVKEIGRLGGDVRPFVSDHVADALRDVFVTTPG
jgi:pantetheine-phosphate adenylyltransferase